MKSRINRHMTEALAGHVLKCILDTEKVKVFRMYRPGTGIYRVQITFTPEGTAIQGDICLGRNQHGVCSSMGYGLSWFSKKLGEGYLCEKFLRKEWQQDVAEEDVKYQLEQATAEWKAAVDEELASLPEEEREKAQAAGSLATDERDWMDKWQRIWNGIKYCSSDLDPRGLDTIASPFITDFWDYEIGMDYPRGEDGWLCAIQQRFAELYYDTRGIPRSKLEPWVVYRIEPYNTDIAVYVPKGRGESWVTNDCFYTPDESWGQPMISVLGPENGVIALEKLTVIPEDCREDFGKLTDYMLALSKLREEQKPGAPRSGSASEG
jgi:hypothetical protein